MKRRSFGGGRRPSHFRNAKKNPVKGKGFDVSKFVNKVTEVQEQEEYVPQHNFEDFDINPRIKENIVTKGYKVPTPIQDQSIPHILMGKDVVGAANTGTGKTAAFLLPMLHKVLNDRSQNVLVLAPTRELAIQIEEEFRGFAAGLGIGSVVCIGGTKMGMQIRALRRKYNFIIGTPGRIKDLIQRKLIRLNRFGNVILDEVDRMLDMGFIHDIRHILDKLPAKRQSLFFSATISKQIDDLIHTFLSDPLKISVAVRQTAANVEQDVIHIAPGQKRFDVMEGLLRKEEFRKVLVFGRTKRGVDRLSRNLFQSGFRVDSIHGDKTQSRRQRALRDFKSNRVRILVATDVAARGLDIDDVTQVINWDVPGTHEDYIHRIGRTGRGDKKGVALTLIGG